MFKPFFVHYNRPVIKGYEPCRLRHAPRGFTAYVRPDIENERNCLVQVTWCSEKDEFKKSEGRSQVVLAESVEFNKRDLPSLMAKCARSCEYHDTTEQDYMYLLKYVV